MMLPKLGQVEFLIVWRIIFYSAVAAAVIIACLPSPPTLSQQINDKLLHFGAFCVLTGLAAKAHPRARLGLLVIALSLLGLGIELLQSLPVVNRNPEAMDFIVEVLAIVVVSIVIRRGLGPSNKRSRIR